MTEQTVIIEILPQTEKEYYEKLCALEKSIEDMATEEGFSWETPGNEEQFRELQRMIAVLKKEITELFATPNSISIYDWESKMKWQTQMEASYYNCICSACIFSQGLDVLLSEKRVPCEMYYEELRISSLGLCGHVKDKKMTLEQLCYSIKYVGAERGEPAALYLFLKKMTELNKGYYGGIEQFLLDNLGKITNG